MSCCCGFTKDYEKMLMLIDGYCGGGGGGDDDE